MYKEVDLFLKMLNCLYFGKIVMLLVIVERFDVLGFELLCKMF